MTTKRQYAGLYEITANGKTFEIEDFGRARLENGDAKTYSPHWYLFETTSGNREFWNDFCTLSDAKEAIRATCL